LPNHVNRVVHLCCGYPQRVDDPGEDKHKADPDSYFKLANALEKTKVDFVSIEDAHRHNDLKLLEYFKHTSIILGVVAIARTKIESVGEIKNRLVTALEHIDRDRLYAAPDCGLIKLPRKIAKEKLKNLVEAARSV